MTDGRLSNEELCDRLNALRDYLTSAAHGTDAFAADIEAIDAALTLQRSADEMRADKARLDWLEAQTVEVWTPLPPGAQKNFMAEAGDNTLREQIDARLKALPPQEDAKDGVTDIAAALASLSSARRILATHHDIDDGGAPGEHPHQKPNWAMRATNAIDEAIEQLPPQDRSSEEK